MSNYNNKNAVWGNKPPISQNNSMQPQLGGLGNLNHSGMVPFQQVQQQQVFQNMGLNQQNLGLGLQQIAATQLNASLASNPIFQQQLSAVSYPNPRGLNPTAFQTSAVNNLQNSSASGTKQRVFTGTVTQIHDNFGFIDDEVFFPRNVVVKGSNPMVGDRVLVEAAFNASMPFKWNATRVHKVLQSNQQQPRDSRGGGRDHSSGYNAVPPPSISDSGNGFGRRADFGRDPSRDRPKATVGERRVRSRDRDDDEVDRKRRREERMREREKEDKDRKSPVRRRSRSPKARRRARIVPRYMVQIPKIALDLMQADVLEVKRRYSNLYIPSDFFNTYIRWVDAFPPNKPYTLNKPCSFHIIYKELDSVNENDAVLEPSDADYRFSAKVMLMSVPGIEEIYQKCCSMAEDKDKRDRDSEERDFVHPTRLVNFLVGLRGKNETMAIGGPWSPSLDGENPEKDPSVLIKTAIRSCKALTGIDLSNCTQWYRFVELYYRRSESTHKGKLVPARVETVVLFLPDVWSCLPTRLEWEDLQQSYRKHLEKILKASGGDEKAKSTEENDDDDEKEEGAPEKLKATHYSLLDAKSMVVADLRDELKARNLVSTGLKSQLVARLTKALKAEAEKDDEESEEKDKEEREETAEVEERQEEGDKKSETDEKKLDEQQRRRLEKQYTLPDQPHLIVHPSKMAKSGKFDCTTMSLSLLLDYRPEDTKEHSFEVSLFAELFNEMLMRDFGFNIFKALHELPEKPKEKEDDKKKKEDKRDEKKDDKKSDDKRKDRKDDDKREDKSAERDKKSEESETKKDRDDDDKKRDRDSKRDERRSDSSEDEDDDDDRRDKKDKDKKKKDRVKLYTKNKHLLLSFVYFDQTHCGYIFDKDVEELLCTLGLNLSRSQVKKLVNKVITRDSLHYRKLTDKPKDEDKEKIENGDKPSEKVIDLKELALGNKRLLPIFDGGKTISKTAKKNDGGNSTSSDGLVVYQGAVVDIGKLLSQLERSEKARIETEQLMVDVKNENHRISEKYAKSSSTIKHLTSEVKEYKEKLRSTEDTLGRTNAHAKLFQTTLMDIRDKIEPILKTVSHKDKEDRKDRDRDSDKKKEKDDSKSRWEKERDSSKKESDKEKEIKKEHDVKKDQKDKENKEESKKEKEESKRDAEKKVTEVKHETESQDSDVEMKEDKNNF